MPTRSRAILAITIAVCVTASSAYAQAAGWEIEAYGGAVVARTAGAGTRTLPPAGAPIVTSNPIFPSRQVPSWFFGDGATLLNGVNAEFGNGARITPLDGVFSPLESARVPVAGVRVRHGFAGRLSAEISVDGFARPADRASALAAAVDLARGTFKAAFADLLGTGPFSGVIVDATGTAVAASHWRETAITLAVNTRLRPWRRVAPYATVGGGVMAGTGSLPSASLEGRYRFSILGEVPIDETDRVSLRFVRRAAFVAVLGGGVQRELSSRWGLRCDARVLVGPDTTRVRLDATPAAARTGPSGFIESFTNPGVQFSNDPSTGRQSTLSGPALQSVEVFSGGLLARTLLTVGVFRRF